MSTNDKTILKSLKSSVNALSSCTFSLQNATSSLERSVADFPRLNTVLGHERCFELVTASELRDAQFSLVSQIEPYIKDVMGKAEAAVLSLEQEHAALNTKAQLAHQRKEKLEEAQELRAKLAKLQQEKQQLANLLEE